ncbi:MAG TPA: GDP-L-fucose synthase [Candidatus Omnitrophota bacterium]|nr:GDP-L-fucose synthase [Candidatus Omnitrophota bacterium]HPN55233.1 GDP-L-fucose synthase [Candidatus Omnitrophota bacterium]
MKKVFEIRPEYKIFVAGHNGMVGSAVVRQLKGRGFSNFVLRSRVELDLMDTEAVKEFFSREKPDIVIDAAARVGGIKANNEHKAEFLYENLVIQNNIIHQAYVHGARKFCFLGSSCIFPRECPQPMKEDYLLTGALEPTNEGYALAKIAGLKMVEYYNRQYGFPGISLMPCNLYGTNDCFDLDKSHVLSALVKKTVDAVDEGRDAVPLWGTGSALREFLHVDDAAAAIVYMMEHYDSPEFINVGSGKEVTIRSLAELIAQKAGFRGRLAWDTSKPDGMARKCMDINRMTALGFTPRISLAEGVERTIAEYRALKRKSSIG